MRTETKHQNISRYDEKLKYHHQVTNKFHDLDSSEDEKAEFKDDTIPRPDDHVCEDIHLAIEHNARIDNADIEIEICDGTVTLSGMVDNFSAKRVVENTVEKILGVKNVVNQLHIRNSFGGEF